MADPFDCFGSDDDSDDDHDDSDDRTSNNKIDDSGADRHVGTTSHSTAPSCAVDAAARRRPDDCGVLAFHPRTEAALLAHVRNAVGGSSSSAATTSNDEEGYVDAQPGSTEDPLQLSPAALRVLGAADDFCVSRHWMMHVGPEKAAMLRGELVRRAREFIVAARSGENASAVAGRKRRRRRFVCAELGTYCGYSSVLIADALRALSAEAKKSTAVASSTAGGRGHSQEEMDDFDFHLYTLEVSKEYAVVAGEMLALAGLTDFVTQILLPLDTAESGPGLADILGDEIVRREERVYPPAVEHARSGGSGGVPPPPPRINFLFVDHDKDLYLPDLRALERAGMVEAGTAAVADNVVFARIDDYVEHMRDLALRGMVRTRTVPAGVEYSAGTGTCGLERQESSEDLMDGMEVTTYLKDPR